MGAKEEREMRETEGYEPRRMTAQFSWSYIPGNNSWGTGERKSARTRSLIKKGVACISKERRGGKVSQREAARADWEAKRQTVVTSVLWLRELGRGVAATIMSDLCDIFENRRNCTLKVNGHLWLFRKVEDWMVRAECSDAQARRAIRQLEKDGYVHRVRSIAYGQPNRVGLRPDMVKVMAAQARADGGNEEAYYRNFDVLAEAMSFNDMESLQEEAQHPDNAAKLPKGRRHPLDVMSFLLRERSIIPELPDFPLNERPIPDEMLAREVTIADRLKRGDIGKTLRADKRRDGLRRIAVIEASAIKMIYSDKFTNEEMAELETLHSRFMKATDERKPAVRAELAELMASEVGRVNAARRWRLRREALEDAGEEVPEPKKRARKTASPGGTGEPVVTKVGNRSYRKDHLRKVLDANGFVATGNFACKGNLRPTSCEGEEPSVHHDCRVVTGNFLTSAYKGCKGAVKMTAPKEVANSSTPSGEGVSSSSFVSTQSDELPTFSHQEQTIIAESSPGPSSPICSSKRWEWLIPELLKILREVRAKNRQHANSAYFTLPDDTRPGEWVTQLGGGHFDPFNRYPGRRGLFRMYVDCGLVWVIPRVKLDLPEETSFQAAEAYLEA